MSALYYIKGYCKTCCTTSEHDDERVE